MSVNPILEELKKRGYQVDQNSAYRIGNAPGYRSAAVPYVKSYSDMLNERLQLGLQYAQQGADYTKDLADSISSGGAMTEYKKGDWLNFDFDARQAAEIDSAKAINYYRTLGLFDSKDFAYDKRYLHLPQTSYLSGLLPALDEEIAGEQKKDAAIKARNDYRVNTWQLWSDFNNRKDTMQDEEKWAYADYLLKGDLSSPFSMDAYNSAWDEMEDDAFYADQDAKKAQYDSLDWGTLLDPDATVADQLYESKVGTLQGYKQSIIKELERRNALEALQASIRADANYSTLSAYTDTYTGPDNSNWFLDALAGNTAKYTVKGYDDLSRFLNADATFADKYIAGKDSHAVQYYLDNGYDYIAPDELADYNALINAGRTEEAKQYLELLRPDLLMRRANVLRSYQTVKAQNPYLAVPTFIDAGILNLENVLHLPQQIYEAAKGIDSPYSAAFDALNKNQWTTSAQLEAIAESNMPDWLKTVSTYGYQGVTGFRDNAMRVLAAGGSPTISLIIAGLQSGSGSLYESSERDDISGAAKIIKAIGVAAIEVGTEKIGLDALFDKGQKGALQYMKNVILSEMGEETLNAMSEPMLEAVVAYLFDHEAEIMSGPEFWQNLTDTAITTAISSIFMGGGGAISNSMSTRNIGRDVTKNGDLEAVLRIADSYSNKPEVSDPAKKIRDKQAKGFKVSNRDVGELVTAVSNAVGEKNSKVLTDVLVESVEGRLEELGEDPANTKSLAEFIANTYLGKKTSLAERIKTKWSDAASQVFKELNSTATASKEVVPGSIAGTEGQLEDGQYVAGDALAAEKNRVGHSWKTAAEEKIAAAQRDAFMETARLNEALNTKTSTTTAVGKAHDKAKNLLKGKPKMATREVMAEGSDGKEVTGTFERVERENGKLLMVMKDADTEIKVDADKITNGGDEGILTIINYAQEGARHEMSADEVNTMVNTYLHEGGDVDSFVQQFQGNYLAGYSGVNAPAGTISGGVASIAYEHGKAEAVKDEADRVARAQRARKVDKPTVGWLGDVTSDTSIKGLGDAGGLDEAVKNMTVTQRAMVEFGRHLAKAAKINVVFFASKAGTDGKYTTQNGSYDPNTHTIYLDINSGASTEKGRQALIKNNTLGAAIGRVAGHELTHVLEATSPEYYAKYKQAVKAALKAKVPDYASLVRGKINTALANGEKLTYAGAEAEVIADASEYMLQDSKFVKNMDQGLKGKVKEIVQKFLNKVNEAFRALTGGHIESAVLRTMTDGVSHYEKQLQGLWDMAFDEMLGAEVVKDGIVDSLYETGEIYSYTTQNSLRVRDKETIKFLENQQHITTYRAMQVIDGELYPPMAEFIGSKKDGNREDPGIIGKWEMAVEHPELIKWVGGKPKFELKKTNDDGSVSTVPAAYNPYMHSSNTVLNDQFSKAFQRTNLVVVECVVPVSESDGAYRAQYAKDATGWHEWKAGVVAGDLAKQKSGFRRDVFLSRYIKPVRILSDTEVAEKIAGYLEGTDVTVPFQSAWPTLRDALVEAGVKVTEPRGLGSPQMKIAMDAFEEWKDSTSEQESLPVQMSSRDRQYMEAVERGDMETAQKMSDAAAKEAGYTIIGYHGTKGPTLRYDADGLGEETDYQNKRLPFTVFKPNPASGIYVASNRAVADGFKTGYFGMATGTTYKLYVKFDNPFVANEHVWTSVPYYDVIPTPTEMKKAGYASNTVATEEIAQYAKSAGYDGVIIEGIKEGFDTQTDDYIAFSPEQVKLADPVVYDDSGNVIPLSERFNAANEDIRYSKRNGYLLDGGEYARFKRNWESRKTNHFTRRKNGGILIDMGNLLVYTNRNGAPQHVLEVLTDDLWTDNSIVQKAVLLETEGYDIDEQQEILESTCGAGSFRFRVPGDRSGNRWETGTGKRQNSRDVRGTDRDEQSAAGTSAEIEITDSPDGIEIDEDTESAAPLQYSIRTWAESDYVAHRNEAAERLAKTIGVSVAKAKKWIDDVNSISAYILGNKARLDYIPTAVKGMSAFKSNPEYGGSIDMSTICAKRRLATGTLDAIQRMLGDAVLTKDDFLHIREMMKERGHEVACGLCFVESSRKNLSKYNKQFLDQYKAEHPDSELGMVDLNTVEGLERIRSNPETADVYAAYEKFMNKLAQRKPKLFEKRTEYNHEILKKFKSDTTVGVKNRNGGLRLQSFSDFEIVHLIDMMQVVTDMASVGLAGQAYTKVPDFAWALGDTGLKINLSLIAKDVDADGNLIFDDVEGMNHLEAEKLRNAYSKNVGTIVVTFTDEQTIAAMKSDFIDYIIPFHRSQWQKGDYKKLGLPEGTKDYTLHQNEKEGRKRVKENFLPNAYWQDDLSGTENAKYYLDMCAKAGRTPKFAKFLVNNGDGSYSLQPDGSTDGYWKLLIDFKMYDNDGNRSKQLPVQPNFNMEQAMRMLEEYKGEHDSFPVAQDVVDAFVKEYRGDVGGVKNTDGRYTVSPVQKSIRDLPEGTVTYRDYLAEADSSIAATIEERNALSIYQKLLKNHAEASETVIEAEAALAAADEVHKPEARKVLAAARVKQKDLYNRLLNVERQAHVQTLVKRSNQIIGDLYGKNQAELDKMLADKERRIASLKADITGLKGAARTQREADIREQEREVAALKSKATKALLANSERYQRQIDEIRLRRDINIEIGKRTRHIKRIVKRLNDRIIHEEDYKNVKEPLKPVVHKLVQTFIDGFGNMVFDQKTADRLRSVYDEIANEDGAPEFYSDDVANWLNELSDMKEWDALIRAEGSSSLGAAEEKLTAYSKVAEIADHIYKLVTAADEIFIDGKREKFNAFSTETGTALVEHKDAKLLVGKARDAYNAFQNLLVKGNLTPQFFFEHLKNSGMTRLFDGLMRGQTEYAQAIREGQEAISEAKKRYNFYAWQNMKTGVQFRTEQGHDIALTVPQMMWVYATAKREATNKLMDTHHLDQGGFRYEAKDLPKQKGKMSAIPGSDRLHKLSQADVEKITNTLTAEQKACADELVSYLSNECAAQGNKASMELFGIKKYNEEYYFPFKTASDQRYQRSDAGAASTTNDARVKHTSFTHSLRKGANTPLVMGDFFDVISDHINLMATYSSFVVPIESMNRVMNTKINEEADGSGNDVTIRSLIGRKYGEASQKYIADLLKDLNGGPQTDNRGGLNALFRAFKRGAVMGSLSVTLQQPTAILRAFAYVNPKYFAHITMEGNKDTWKRMMKHSGTAVIKDMGKFDVGTGHMANDWIANSDIQEYKVLQRARFLMKTESWKAALDNTIEFLTSLPGVMDRITWTHIWKAVEAEQADQHPGMDRNSDEFLDMVGKRFDDVINHTQVYDSVLAKSQNMRSKNPLTQMSTAFMSEPTLNANLYYSAVTGDHTAGQRAGIVTSVIASNLLAAAMAALISAWNKDDDERKFTEKYLAAFASRAVDNLNPMTMYPYLSDLWSMVSGYDIERTDMSVVQDIWDYGSSFIKKLAEGEDITWRDRENFYGTIANLFGIPGKNVSRDIRRIRNLITTDKSASSPSAVKYTLLENAIPLGLWKDSNKAYCQRLVAAVADGDKQEVYDLWDFLTNTKKPSQNTINTNVRDELKRRVQEGSLTPEQATEILRKYAPYKNDKDNLNKPKEWAE